MDKEALLCRIAALEKENAELKKLLNKAGILYPSEEPIEIAPEPVQSTIIPESITHNHARLFYSFFWGRTDVYAKRFENKITDKSGYYPQCDNFWKPGICPKSSGTKIQCKNCQNKHWTKLTANQIERHLKGMDVVGIYPLFPDGTCRLLVFDFDDHDNTTKDQWMKEVDALRKIGALHRIPMLVERSRSGNGAHVWIFFNTPISATLARKFGFTLLNKGAESVNLTSFRFYDRMIPAQDSLSDGDLSNLVVLPLQGKALEQQNSAFVDEKWVAYPDQWTALRNSKKLPIEQINDYLKLWNNNSESADDTKPWERTKHFHASDCDDELSVTLSDGLYIKTANLKPRLQNQIRRLAAFSNPLFYRNQAMGLSNHANSRILYLGYDDAGFIYIPRGLQDVLNERCVEAGIPVSTVDRRSPGTTIHAIFEGQLRSNQEDAVRALLQHNTGILSAATAFGKTVVCSNMIAQRKVNTLIILESSSLVEQWKKSLEKFLCIDEPLPEYTTPTGRIKKRSSHIGIIQGTKDTSTGIVDIAMAGSLFKKGEPHKRLNEYGMILVDECHHSASETVSKVLRSVSAKYVYGVTATPFRSDHLGRINEMLLGPVRFTFSAKEKAAEQGIGHFIVPRFTRAVCPHGQDRLKIQDAYAIVWDNELRNQQIVEDIKECIGHHRTPVVLTKFKSHAELLFTMTKGYADHIFLLTGSKSKKEQQAIRAEMDAVSTSETMLLIATGQLIGEGFDYPRLDTLIMACPVAFKGIIEQYAGRLHRDFEGKENVMIYDYIDAHIPVFDAMYAKRLKAYKRIGYELYKGPTSEKQSVNAIYDSDSYTEIYEQDLKEATKEIVISSPTLGRQKVMRIINLLKQKQEAGIKVTIVTWHPDCYKYGSDVHRIELMDTLRSSGFHIELMRDNCQHFAVIDNEVVWYGSMNLLSKDDMEDNIMRLTDKSVAAELLEMTFGKTHPRQEFQLPLR